MSELFFKEGVRLGVNIDHVATLRQARGESYPSVAEAARVCLRNRADQITIHLREDRRHIQDYDVFDVRAVTKEFARPLNLEMGCAPEIIGVAKRALPDWVCLVPEKRAERTTEGGLALKDPATLERVRRSCEELKGGIPNLKISLFLEGDRDVLELAISLGRLVDAVEVHTGSYASAFLKGENLNRFGEQFAQAKQMLRTASLGCHAGHGLTFASTLPLLRAQLFAEYNIGHSLISEAIFSGLGPVISQMKEAFDHYTL